MNSPGERLMFSSLIQRISSASQIVAESSVVNASPLIYLARAGHLDLLKVAAERILVTDAVANEVRQYDDPAKRALDTTVWLEVVPAPPIPAIIAAWDLGAGESSVLSL